MRWSRRCHEILQMHTGWYALFAAVGLTLIGIEAIRTTNTPQYASKQMTWFAISLIVMAACLVPRPRVIGLWSYGLLLATLLLLVFVVLPFVPRTIVPRINQTTAWIDLGILRLQPSEPAKLTFVLAVAWYLRHRRSYRTLPGLLVPMAIMFVPVALILKQPDLGTALVFAPTLLIMLLAAGARLKHIGSMVAVAALVMILAVASIYVAPPLAGVLLRPHQQVRFKALISKFLNDNRYDQTFGYQQEKSMELIGSGRWHGYGQARSSLLISAHRLPEAHNDMIFAVIVNRWGLAGGLIVCGLYLAMVLCFLLIAGQNKDPFARLAVVGFAGLLLTQASINIAVNIGLLPVTGITLPFVSYGGSSLVATFAMVALAINFASQPAPVPSRPSFEFT